MKHYLFVTSKSTSSIRSIPLDFSIIIGVSLRFRIFASGFVAPYRIIERIPFSSGSCISTFEVQRYSSTMSNQNEFKRLKVSSTKVPSQKVIGTHSGTFQADEALGVWLLRQLPTYHQSKVVRTRDEQVLKDLDVVIDVGGVYDVSFSHIVSSVFSRSSSVL
jgi:hypothetical protein